jgi:hypothetical protein
MLSLAGSRERHIIRHEISHDRNESFQILTVEVAALVFRGACNCDHLAYKLLSPLVSD